MFPRDQFPNHCVLCRLYLDLVDQESLWQGTNRSNKKRSLRKQPTKHLMKSHTISKNWAKLRQNFTRTKRSFITNNLDVQSNFLPDFYSYFPNMTARQKFVLFHGARDDKTIATISVCIKFSKEYSDSLPIFSRYAFPLIANYLINVIKFIT